MDAKLEKRSDEELMVLYQGGEVAAFEVLFRRHSGRVLGYLQKRTNQQAARDLLQQSFLKLHRSRQNYTPPYPFLPWLFAITRNALIDSLRQAKRFEASESGVDVESVAAPEPPASGREELGKALADLPASQKQAIELRYLSEWTFEQIATEMDTSPENVRQIISRGIRRIRAALGGSGE